MVKYILMVNLQRRIRLRWITIGCKAIIDTRLPIVDIGDLFQKTILWVNHYLYGGRATQIVVDLAAYGGTECLVGLII